MKDFKIVIFVMVFAFSLQGDAKKVCILYEQNIVPTSSILSEDSIKNEILDVNEENQISDVTDEVSITEKGVTDSILVDVPVILNSDVKPTSICALEGITLFDDQNVCILIILNSRNLSHYLNENIVYNIILLYLLLSIPW